jgi:hypothetical protein
MTAGTADRWHALGAMLIQRRTALNPRWHNRTEFAQAVNLSYRLVYDAEEARRSNFGTSTLAALEAAYRLAPGSIARFLAGDELEPQEPAAPLAEPAPPRRQLRVLDDPSISPSDLDAEIAKVEAELIARTPPRDATEARIWQMPDLLPDERRKFVAVLRILRRGPGGERKRMSGLVPAG